MESTKTEPTTVDGMKIQPRSFHYASGLRWTGEMRGALAALDRPRIEIAAPPEFHGHPGFWTPEDLLVAAVNACTMMTFLSLAKRKGLGIVSYESEATGRLETEGGEFRFTRIVVRPRIEIATEADRPKTLALLQDAEDRCLVANSLVCMIEGAPEVRVRS
jgi:organic hydroperoxide reductase OsmC/OhrA